MTKERASIFGDDDDQPAVDVSDFKPKAPPPIDQDAIRRAAEAQGFTSREPPPKRTRRKRSNRTAQVSFRVTPETQTRFHAYMDNNDVDQGDFLDLALDALEGKEDRHDD